MKDMTQKEAQAEALRRWGPSGRITFRPTRADRSHDYRGSSGFATQLGFWWAVTGLDYFYGYVDTMARQSPDDLRRYATTYIIGKPRAVGVVLPAEAHAALSGPADHR